jgi:hypothetical protein
MAENDRAEKAERQITTPADRTEDSKVLNDVNPDRDEVYKEQRQKMKLTGEQFTMSKIDTGTSSASKFELVDSPPEAPSTEPQRKERFHSHGLDEPIQRLKDLPDKLYVTAHEMKALQVWEGVSAPQQSAIQKEMEKLGPEDVKEYLTQKWSAIGGWDREVDMQELAEAFKTATSDREKALLMSTMLNFNTIQTKSDDLGLEVISDLTKSDLEKM